MRFNFEYFAGLIKFNVFDNRFVPGAPTLVNPLSQTKTVEENASIQCRSSPQLGPKKITIELETLEIKLKEKFLLCYIYLYIYPNNYEIYMPHVLHSSFIYDYGLVFSFAGFEMTFAGVRKSHFEILKQG